MANYNAGLATKNKIIEICKELFYVKGYKETTFKDIAEKTQVYPGSISYHFKEKKNIAAQIYNEFMGYYTNRINELFPNEDEQMILILYLAVHQRVLYADAAYRKFSIAFTSEYYSLENLTDYTHDFSTAYSYAIKIVDRQTADFYFAAFTYMDIGIESFIDLNIDKLRYEDAVNYTIRLYYSFISNEGLGEKIKRALQLVSALDIKNKGFDIIIDFKKQK